MRRKDISLNEVYQRYVRWHKEVSEGSDIGMIAEEDGYSPLTIRYGIKRVSELLLVDKGLRAMYYGKEEPDRKTLLINELHVQVKKRHITQLNYRTLQKLTKELLIIIEDDRR